MPRRTYANRLEAAMRKQHLSVRKLGKLIDPVNPEQGRRRVQRHLSGTSPTRMWREVYAMVLKDSDLAEPDEEPSRPASLETTLMETLREVKALRRELQEKEQVA